MKNSKDTQFLTCAEQVAIAKKSGIASGKARRAREESTERYFEELLEMPIKDGVSREIYLATIGIEWYVGIRS